MFDKVNVCAIVKDHINTFRDYSTKRYRFWDFLLFFGIPYPIGFWLDWVYGTPQAELISIVATGLSMSTALLFCVLMLAYDAIGNTHARNEIRDSLRRDFLAEVISNISFAILISICTVVAILCLVLIAGNRSTSGSGNGRLSGPLALEEAVDGEDGLSLKADASKVAVRALGSFIFGSIVLFFSYAVDAFEESACTTQE